MILERRSMKKNGNIGNSVNDGISDMTDITDNFHSDAVGTQKQESEHPKFGCICGKHFASGELLREHQAFCSVFQRKQNSRGGE